MLDWLLAKLVVTEYVNGCYGALVKQLSPYTHLEALLLAQLLENIRRHNGNENADLRGTYYDLSDDSEH